MKPCLLDKIVTISRTEHTEIAGRWYIAKPLSVFTWKLLIVRLKHAVLVICGKAFAVQYAEDFFTKESEEG